MAATHISGVTLATPYTSPKVNYKITYSATRLSDQTKAQYTFSVQASLGSTGSSLGDGYVLSGKLTVGGVTKTFTIKSSSEKWSGTTAHTTSVVIECTSTSTSNQTVTFVVDQTGTYNPNSTVGEINTGSNYYVTPPGFTKYTITYKLNGGTYQNSTSDFTQDCYYTSTLILPTPTRTGYTFHLWNVTSAAGNWSTTAKYNGGTSISNKYGNATMTAQWTANTNTSYTVEYWIQKVGGNQPTFNSTNYELKATENKTGTTGAQVTPTVSKTYNGYDTPSTQTVTIAADGSTVVQYIYYRTVYDIKYNLNGGTASDDLKTTYSILSDSFTLPSVSKTGYAFTGWTGSNGTTPSKTVTISKGTYGDKEYTANFTVYKATIHYYSNGGTAKSGYALDSSNRATEDGSLVTSSISYGSPSNVYDVGTLFSPPTGYYGPSSGTDYYTSGWRVGSSTSTTYATQQNYNANSHIQSGNATVKFYARWIPSSYTITFNYNNGSGSTDSLQVTYNSSNYSSWNDLANAFRAGYTLAGYYDAKSGGKQIYKIGNDTNGNLAGLAVSGTYWDSNKWKYAGNVTAYAQWTGNTYYVKYNGNGSTSGSMSNSTHTYGTSSNLTEKTFARAYKVTFDGNGATTNSKTSQTATYTFKNWNTKSNGSGTSYADQASVSTLTTTAGGTVNLYAQWTSASVTLPTASQCKRTGYTLLGFSTSNSATSASYSPGASYTPTAAITLYAVWQINSYTVTLAKGTGISSVSGAGTYNYGASVTIKATISTGYTWSKWTGTKETTTQNYTFTMPANDVSNTANATLNTYTISYTLNGGSVATANPTSYNVTTTTFTLNNPTKTGYTFSGWTGTGLSSASTSVSVTKGSTGNRSYTATWTPNTNTAYKVKHWKQNIDAATTQGSTNYTLATTENLTGTTGASVTPARKTYTGFTSPSGTTITIAADGSSELNYYYTRNSYTLSLAKGTGISSVSGAGTYHYEKSVTINATVSAGYSWKEWTGGKATTTQSYTFKMPAEAVSNTANATAHVLTVNYYAGGATSGTLSSTNLTTSQLNGTSLLLTQTGNYGENFNKVDGSPGLVDYNNSSYLSLRKTGYSVQSGSEWKNKSNGKICDQGGTGNQTVTTVAIAEAFGVKTDLQNGNISIDVEVNWQPNIYTITLNNQSATTIGTQTLYLKYNTGWYSNSGATTSINSITCPTKTGHTFGGYYTSTGGSGTQIIDSSGNVVSGKTTFTSSNTTLYAKWTANTYTVTFNANGGSVSTTSKSVTYNSTYGTLPTPTRNGYSFNGWYTASSGGTKRTSSTTVTTTSNHTLYAQWTPNTYTITLNNQSATTAGTQTLYLKYDTDWYSNSGATTSILKITIPTKTGHTFKGYYTSTGGSGTKIIEENGTIDKNNLTFTTSNTTLYAYWTTQPILQIHPNGGTYNGTSGITSIAQDANTELELLKPTRDGYEFAGWFKNYPGELKFKAQITTGAVEVPGWSSSGTVVGTWLYTETNQDSIFSNSNFLTAYNSTLTRKSSTSAGYDYTIEIKASNVTGGFIQSTSGTTELISGTGQIMTSVLYTFLAKIPIGYSLTSSKSSQTASDGIRASWQTPTKGTGNWETYSYTITSNAQVTVGNICIHLKKDDTALPSNVTWEVGGCCVQRPGWNATFTFGDADTNLYAQWKPVKSTLSFKGDFLPDASSFPDGSEKKIITYYQTDHNNFWSNLSTATRNGYSLKGYYDAATGGNQIFDNTGNYVSGTYWDSNGKWKYTGNKDVYAQWEINKYTITFNANGGSEAPSSQTKIYGQTLTLSSTKPTRAGYTFQGWGTSATTTAVSYQAGGSYTNNSNITLYAIWKVVSYSISYNLNGGSVTGNPTSYTIETTTFTLKNPTKEGYKFIGWTGTNLNSSALEVTIAKGSTGNKSYTANWEAFGTVRIYTNDGWKQAIPYIYDGNSWKQAIPYVYDGNNWKIST